MLNRLMNWWRGRKKSPARLNPLILRTTEGSLHARKPEVQNPSQIEVAEAEMNIAMRTDLSVMAIEGLITREQAKEFTETHAVVVAYRGGIHGIEEYCVAITVHDVVSGTQKFVHCSSARLSGGDCGPGGKLWKPRKGLISCPR